MEWWSKMTTPLRSFTFRVAARLGFRKRAGLLKLGSDVRACEYEDVHVMWEMLKRNETEEEVGFGGESRHRRRRSFWNIFGWARSAPCIGCRF